MQQTKELNYRINNKMEFQLFKWKPKQMKQGDPQTHRENADSQTEKWRIIACSHLTTSKHLKS